MKKFLTLLLCTSVFFLSACGQDSNSFVGEWVETNPVGQAKMITISQSPESKEQFVITGYMEKNSPVYLQEKGDLSSKNGAVWAIQYDKASDSLIVKNYGFNGDETFKRTTNK